MGEEFKVFVGGLSQETTKESLNAYFAQFGNAGAIVMMDGSTGRSRGFGFVDFSDEATLNAVLASNHTIDDAQVSIKRHSGDRKSKGGGKAAAPMGGKGGNVNIEDSRLKMFVGGLSQSTTKEMLDTYFNVFGPVDSHIMMDGQTGRSRGFAFINFRDPNTMSEVLESSHEIDGVPVTCTPHSGGRSKGGGGGGAKGGAKGGFGDARGGGPPRGGGGAAKGGGGGAGGLGKNPEEVLSTTLSLIAQLAKGLQGTGGGGAAAADQLAQLAATVQQVVPAGGKGGKAGGGGGGGGGGGFTPTGLKIFVGGLPQSATKQDLSGYFSQWGNANGIVMMDKSSGRSRGFGFVDFDDASVMNAVLDYSAHEIHGTPISVSVHGDSKGKGGGRSAPY